MRQIYIDNLRAFLMALGLILHTCAAFSTEGFWIVTYHTPLAWAGAVNDFIHIFRMPLFFMISGYFAFILMQRQTKLKFTSTKIVRIGLPFLSVLLLINLPQFLYLEHLIGLDNKFNIQTNSLRGHLWFLVNLLIYFVIYTLLHSLVIIFTRLLLKFSKTFFILIVTLLTPLLFISILALNKVGIPIYEPIPILGSVFILMGYFDYFMLGAVFGCLGHTKFLSDLHSNIGRFTLFVLFILSVTGIVFSDLVNSFSEPYFNHTQAIFLSLLLWLCAEKTLNYSSKLLRAFADSSYSIYLFHHSIIIFLIILFNSLFVDYNLKLNPNVLFLFVIIFTFTATLLIHFYIIRKSQFLSFMFNGNKVKSLQG